MGTGNRTKRAATRKPGAERFESIKSRPALEAQVHTRLDARLNPVADAPLAVALSGGSDSLALTLIAAGWARGRGRPLLILTVDHGLRPDSAGWTQTCAAHADRLGAAFRALAWTGDKPPAGLPAAARQARHALLAAAAREAGAKVVLMGHTADDLAESAAMRAAGATVPDAREWGPSPVWPEGRGVFLLRPLLGQRRDELRAWLAARGETWIEDPANADLRFARARARAAGATATAAPAPAPDLGALGLAARAEPGGGLVLPRQALREAAPEVARAFVGVAALCAAGSPRPPRGDRLARLTEGLRGPAPVIATLAGARIEADADTVSWRREPGEFRRIGPPSLHLAADQRAVWDGRFELCVDRRVEILPLAGRAGALTRTAREALRRLPASARGTLPAAVAAEGVTCPLLTPEPGVEVTDLVLTRLRAACGLIVREA